MKKTANFEKHARTRQVSLATSRRLEEPGHANCRWKVARQKNVTVKTLNTPRPAVYE